MSPTVQSITNDTEEWYREAVEEKAQEAKLIRESFSILYHVLDDTLRILSKKLPSAEWLFHRLQKRSPYLFEKAMTYMQNALQEQKRPQGYSSAKEFVEVLLVTENRLLMARAVRTFCTEEIILRDSHVIRADVLSALGNQRVKAFADFCYTKLYTCSVEEVTHVLEQDSIMVSTLLRMMVMNKLSDLSSVKTNMRDCRTPRVSESERRQWMEGLVGLSQWLHPDKTAAYLTEHLRWNAMPLVGPQMFEAFNVMLTNYRDEVAGSTHT